MVENKPWTVLYQPWSNTCLTSVEGRETRHLWREPSKLETNGSIFALERWITAPADRCRILTNSYRKHLVAVIFLKYDYKGSITFVQAVSWVCFFKWFYWKTVQMWFGLEAKVSFLLLFFCCCQFQVLLVTSGCFSFITRELPGCDPAPAGSSGDRPLAVYISRLHGADLCQRIFSFARALFVSRVVLGSGFWSHCIHNQGFTPAP